MTKYLMKEKGNLFLGAIEKGLVYSKAAIACGISPSTVVRWLNEGKADLDNGIDSEESQFFVAVSQARNKFEQTHLENISTIAVDEKEWRASAFLLERVFPETYGKTAQVDVTHNVRFNADDLARIQRQLNDSNIIEGELSE